MKENNTNFDNATEENFLKNKQRRKNHVNSNNNNRKNTSFLKVLKIFGFVCASIAAFFTAVFVGIAIYYFSLDNVTDSNKPHAVVSDDDTLGPRAELSSDSNDTVYKYNTFLATATDFSGSLTDVIMVARLHNVETNPEVSILQIPRDTYVTMSSKLHVDSKGNLTYENFNPKASTTYPTKINAVYYHGRKLGESHIKNLLSEANGKSKDEISALCSSNKYRFLNAEPEKIKSYVDSKDDAEKKVYLEEITTDFGITYLSTLIYYYFGIEIDYQAKADLSGFRSVVDAVGGEEGIYINVPERMYYEDPYQDLYIDLYPGPQYLDGDKAEQFVRYRGYKTGDIGRLNAQKTFINAFLDKLLSPSTITRIDDIVVEVKKNVYTSISVNDMLRFSKTVIKLDADNGVKIVTLPGVGEYVGGVSYFLPYKQETVELVNNDFNVFANDISADSFRMIDYYDVAPSNTSSSADSSNDSSSDDNDSSSEESDSDETMDNEEAEENDNNSESSDDNAEGNENTDDNEETEADETENGDTIEESDNNENEAADSKESDENESEVDSEIETEHEPDIEIPVIDEENEQAGSDEPVSSGANILMLGRADRD
ncbi:MAG: hypothetical protein E7600_03850 [Ruminococcaceae bacterium]|nr:hypothetical protein [Oscillospiraceae bacterium]